MLLWNIKIASLHIDEEENFDKLSFLPFPWHVFLEQRFDALIIFQLLYSMSTSQKSSNELEMLWIWLFSSPGIIQGIKKEGKM